MSEIGVKSVAIHGMIKGDEGTTQKTAQLLRGPFLKATVFVVRSKKCSRLSKQ